MIFFDFSSGIYPVSENPYFQKVILFVENWEKGMLSIKLQTSGSTGIPKTIDVNRAQMVASAKLTSNYFQIKEKDHAFCCINIDFIGGMMMIVRAIELKLQLSVIEPVNNPFLNIHSVVEIDFIALVPMQMQAILENENSKNFLLEKTGLKNIIIGGAKINDSILDEISKINIPIYATYGMTETVSHIAVKRLNGNEKSIFFSILTAINIKVDERNCLAIKGECTQNQWVQTNDIVELKSNKSFLLIGRADRVINSGGIKIFLDQLEKEIELDVFEYFGSNVKYFLFGNADEKLGEKLCLLIESKNSECCLKPILIFEKSNIIKYKIPKEVFFLPKFVTTPSGKIDYINTISILNIN